MLSLTTPTHVDYRPLRDTLAFLSDLVPMLHACKKDADNFARVLEVQNKFVGEFKVNHQWSLFLFVLSLLV